MGIKNNCCVEIKNGDRITLRNGDVLTFDEYYDRIVNAEDSRLNYKDNLEHKTRRELDIVEVKRPVEYKTIFTEEDRIATDEVATDEVATDDVLEAVSEKIKDVKLQRGNIIVITL